MMSIGRFAAESLDGEMRSLSEFNGKVALVVNTASKCGFTPQYAGLEELWRRYAEHGFVVLGFPCNQFGKQEPGDSEEIAAFCSSEYDVTFPLFAKVDVNGPSSHPLWKWLRTSQDAEFGDLIKWNFTKFLVGRNGQVIARYSPRTPPEEIEQDIVDALMKR